MIGLVEHQKVLVADRQVPIRDQPAAGNEAAKHAGVPRSRDVKQWDIDLAVGGGEITRISRQYWAERNARPDARFLEGQPVAGSQPLTSRGQDRTGAVGMPHDPDFFKVQSSGEGAMALRNPRQFIDHEWISKNWLMAF